MSGRVLFLLGATHQRTPLEVREKLALAGEAAEAMRADLRGLPGLAELCGGVAFLEAFTREDEFEGDHVGFQSRTASWYRKQFQAQGLQPVGSHCWLAATLADQVAALEGA